MSEMPHLKLTLEIVFTRAAPAFHNLFMGCVFNINTVHNTVEKLRFKHFIEVHIHVNNLKYLSLKLLKKE